MFLKTIPDVVREGSHVSVHSFGHVYGGTVAEISSTGKRARVLWRTKAGKRYDRWITIPGKETAQVKHDVVYGTYRRTFGNKAAATKELKWRRERAARDLALDGSESWHAWSKREMETFVAKNGAPETWYIEPTPAKES